MRSRVASLGFVAAFGLGGWLRMSRPSDSDRVSVRAPPSGLSRRRQRRWIVRPRRTEATDWRRSPLVGRLPACRSSLIHRSPATSPRLAPAFSLLGLHLTSCCCSDSLSIVAMSKRISSPKMHKLQLSVEDAREMRLLSADFEKELMRTYEDYLFRDNRRVDERRWRSIRTQEDVHVYRERSAFKEEIHPVQPLFERNALSTSAVEIGPHAAMAANSKMPVLMGTGMMPGVVEDAMFGATFHDTASLRTRNAYIKDQTEDSVVLATIDGPSHDDPFRFLGIVWYYKVYPIMLMQNRDLLLLIDIRMTQLSNGERVGINLYHSIQHRDAPVLREHNILRMDFSLGIIYRQLDDHRFEVFMLSFIDPRGSTPEALTVQDSAKALLSITNTCDAGFRKKLFWRMRERQKHRGRAVSHPDHENDNHCAMCRKSFSGLFVSSGATCQICSKRVCSKCSMAKNIVIEATHKAVTAKPFDFCLVCTLDTKEVPALTIARDEQYERSMAVPRNPVSSTSSFSSSASVGSI